MIVERGHVGLIISGRRKRGVVRVDQTTPGYRERKPRIGGGGQSRQLVRPRNPRVGDRIAIRQRGSGQTVEVVVTDRRQALAAEVTAEDATAMGYRTLASWQAWWVREQAPMWCAREEARQLARWAAGEVGVEIDERLAHALAAECGQGVADAMLCCYTDDLARALIEEGATARAEDDPPVSQTVTVAQMAERFAGFHANDPVWIIDHVLAVDSRPLLLADQPGPQQADYVRSPAAAMSGSRDPGEAIEPALQERLSREAAERDTAERVRAARERRTLPLDERIRRLQEQKDIDLSSDLRLIAHRVNKAADRLKAAGVEE